MPDPTPLQLFNSLTRTAERFVPADGRTARVYSCGPTVYNYAHIGNLRAYVFTDTLRRALAWHGWGVRHVINITDVGHLTSDADAGEDKMELAAAGLGRDIWEVAAFYTRAFKADLGALNILDPTLWSVATEHIEEMKAFASQIEAVGYTYQLTEEDAPGAAGLYFDVKKLGDEYGRLARGYTEAAHSPITDGRIGLVEQKNNVADFALWRATPSGEIRQMEWSSPWGRGAPGWHLECSVMSHKYLGSEFDIHTGGIDHREIHHPNEIAQNQAHRRACCGAVEPGFTGARVWMHNNFLVERGGKMAKSAGGFTTLPSLVACGVHPLAYRLLCLSAHYRSELDFSGEALAAALTRLKRLVLAADALRARAAPAEVVTDPRLRAELDAFGAALADDLNTPRALTHLDTILTGLKKADAGERLTALLRMDEALGLRLLDLRRADLRVAPENAGVAPEAIEARLDERQAARAARDFARGDAIRDALLADGVEVMDGDPLRWDWRVRLD